MEQVTVRIPITVKAKVTDKLKEQLLAECRNNIDLANQELEQIDFQGRRMLTEQAKVDAQGLTALRERLDAERGKRLDVIAEMEERIRQTEKLELGAEILRGNMERTVTLAVGDDLDKIMGAEILLESGKIIAFRE